MVWLNAILGKLQNPEGGSLYEAPDLSKIDDPFYMYKWENEQKASFNKALKFFGCQKIIIRNASRTDTWIDSNLEHSNYPAGYLRYNSADNNYITQNSVSTNNGLVLILEFDAITNGRITCNSTAYPSLENNSLAIFTNYNDVNTYNITWGEDRNPHLFKGTDDESVDSFQIGFANPYFRETIDNEIINVNEFLYSNLNRTETHTIVVSNSGTSNQKIILDGNHIKDEEKYNYLRIATFDNDIVSITYEKLENGTYNIPSTEYLNSALMMPSNFAYRFDNSDLSSPMLDNVMEREEHSRHQSNVTNENTEYKNIGNIAQKLNTIKRFGIHDNAINCLQNNGGKKEITQDSGQFYDRYVVNNYKYLNTELVRNFYIGDFSKDPVYLNDEYFLLGNTIYRKNRKDRIISTDYPNITSINRVLGNAKPLINGQDMPYSIRGNSNSYKIKITSKLSDDTVEKDSYTFTQTIPFSVPKDWNKDSSGYISMYDTYALYEPLLKEIIIEHTVEFPVDTLLIQNDQVSFELKRYCIPNYGKVRYNDKVLLYFGYELKMNNVKTYLSHDILNGTTYTLTNRDDAESMPANILPTNNGFRDLKTWTGTQRFSLFDLDPQYRKEISNFYIDENGEICCSWLKQYPLNPQVYDYSFIDINSYGISPYYKRSFYLIKGE